MAVLTNTGLETHPAGTVNVGGIINGNWQTLEDIFNPALSSGDAKYQLVLKALIRGSLPTDAAHLEWNGTKLIARAGYAAVTYAASVAIDFLAALTQRISLTGNLTLTTTNLGVGRKVTVYLTADASLRTLTFPASWIWTSAMPADIAASKAGKLELTSTTGADTGVFASWTVAP